MVLHILSFLMIAVVILPVVRKDYWLFRVFDYPRLQKFSLIIILCISWISLLRGDTSWYDYAMLAMLLSCLCYLAFLIYPYTFLGKQMIRKVKNTKGLPSMRILVSNVFQENRNYKGLLKLIKERKPDIVFLLETNDAWMKGVEKLRKEYPYHIEVPQENTYGLLFYSKFPIKDHEVNYLIDKDVPSVSVNLEVENQTVKIYGLHPTPPVPQENTHSTERDAEILLIGKKAKKEKGPCLVIGDLNDVAWSNSTTLFLKTSGLLDPRRGRGLYSTFHAKYWFLRWPLDHYFVSGHFRLVDMKVEKNIGSDHFPISICLVISNEDDDEKLDISAGEKKRADKKVNAGLKGDPQ